MGSPISASGLLYYNTLFDENASNHIAIGAAYPTCYEGGSELSEEEMDKAGINVSITHEDFMVGSAEMDIDGIHADGTVEAVFRKGIGEHGHCTKAAHPKAEGKTSKDVHFADCSKAE